MYDIIFSKKFILPTLVIGVIYVITLTYLMNFSLIKDAFTGGYSFVYITNILIVLLEGMWTAMSGIGLVTLFLIALLTGANLTLLWQKIISLRQFKGLHLVVGGNSLLGIVGSGCAACGLPILALLGLSGSLIYLPFHGEELSYISIILLSISFYLLLKGVNEQQCAIPVKKRKYL